MLLDFPLLRQRENVLSLVFCFAFYQQENVSDANVFCSLSPHVRRSIPCFDLPFSPLPAAARRSPLRGGDTKSFPNS